MEVKPIVVRDFRPADLRSILEIQLTSPEMAQWHRADYEALSQTSGGIILIAEPRDEPGAMVGFLAALETGQEAEIQNLAVRFDYRRRGVARALIREAHRRLDGRSARQVFLEVRLSNLAARNLYRSLGYSECGLRRGYYASDGEDALVLRRQLSGVPSD